MTAPPIPKDDPRQRPTLYRRSLRFRLGLILALAIAGVAAGFAILISAHTRQEVLSQTISQNQQTAEVIRRSIRYAMLQNHREQVAQIIEAVSRTRGIEKIRIFDKEGAIITSTLPSEVGTRVDKDAEACFHCHSARRPLQQLPGAARHRIYRSSVGHRILGTIDVIRNEPACSTADCHAHPASVTVLGVLDIAYSLDAFDASERSDIFTVAGITAASAAARAITNSRSSLALASKESSE